MRKFVTILAAVTAVATGVAALQIKATVQAKTDDVKALARQIHDDREAIRIVEAEWAYLTAPSVLQERSIEFLALMPPRAKQIVGDPSLVPFRPRGVEVEGDPGVLLPARHDDEGSAKKRAVAKAKKKEREL